MPKGYKPAVFVSSTCYDLSQIRDDIKIFIESIGLDPVLSEQNSFPVNPNNDTIENCLEVVNDKADILVLIVGDRYGSQTDAGKSITNLEHLTAVNKGIPIYIFIKESIINNLPIWNKNKEADYSSIVDSPKLLEFADSLRNESNNWVYPFENAQDITSTLKEQFAYLFMSSLKYRSFFQGELQISDFKDLSPKSLEIIFTKPNSWEYSLFAQILKDNISSYQTKRLDLQYGVNYGKAINIEDIVKLSSWFSSHLSGLQQTIDSITNLINTGLPKAFGKSGVSGDEKHIVYIATRITEGYLKIIEWTLDFNKIDSPDEFKTLFDLGSHFTDNIIAEIENFVEKLFTETKDAIASIKESSVKKEITFTLSLTLPDMTALFDEIERLRNVYK